RPEPYNPHPESEPAEIFCKPRHIRHIGYGNQPAIDRHGRIKISSAEENPGKRHTKEGEPARNAARPPCVDPANGERLPAMIDDEHQPMRCPPEHEGPCRPMPETTKRHGDEEVRIAPQLAAPVAAERDVEIVAQKARQRHMPAPPEI